MSDGVFYERERGAHGEERFFATELTRGPWSNDHQHGGPPTALLARAIEEPGMFVVRMTCELLRPVPIAAPLEVVTEQLAASRNVQRVAAALVSGEEQLAIAVAILIRLKEQAIPQHALDDGPPLPPLERCRAFEFPFFRHIVGYHTAIEVRAAEGEFGQGKFAAWMRPRVPLIASEQTTPLAARDDLCRRGAWVGHGARHLAVGASPTPIPACICIACRRTSGWACGRERSPSRSVLACVARCSAIATAISGWWFRVR